MAETLLSPGVLARENDQSFLQQAPIQAGAAIMGPTVKGPLVPTLVTTYSDFVNRFGSTFTSGSSVYSYFTSIAAYNYFNQGGDSLLVARVVPDRATWTNATSSWIPTEGAYDDIYLENPVEGVLTVADVAAVSGSGIAYLATNDASKLGSYTVTGDTTKFAKPAFILETLPYGEIQNDFVAPTNPTASWFVTQSYGALESGSSNNLRFQIVNPNVSAGTFSVIIRQGNDNDVTQTVLETYPNVSLDPKAANYIERVIGTQTETVQLDPSTGQSYIQVSGSFPNISRYVRVKQVNFKTPDYFDNNGVARSEYTASIPRACSGVFGGGNGNMLANGTDPNNYYELIGTNTQGVYAADYVVPISLLSNPDEYQYNVVSAPGLIFSNTTAVDNENQQGIVRDILTMTQERGDALAVVDLVPYNSQVAAPIAQANLVDTSYGASYWPWLQTIDPDSGELVWVPASTMIPAVYAFNDKATEPWFAPAGFNRGGLNTVVRAERKLTQSDRDALYQAKVNPIATFPNQGIVVFGQKTLQTRASALDRVNVRRLLIQLKSYISQIADNLVFEQNTIATRNRFLSQVNPYLENVQQKQGLYAFKVVMDDTNNTADVVDRNEIVGQIYIQPTRTAEYVLLDFNILPTGAVFPS